MEDEKQKRKKPMLVLIVNFGSEVGRGWGYAFSQEGVLLEQNIFKSHNAIKHENIPTLFSTSFGKLFFCLALYTGEENLQTFSKIHRCIESFILVIGFKKSNIFIFSHSKNHSKICKNW